MPEFARETPANGWGGGSWWDKDTYVIPKSIKKKNKEMPAKLTHSTRGGRVPYWLLLFLPQARPHPGAGPAPFLSRHGAAPRPRPSTRSLDSAFPGSGAQYAPPHLEAPPPHVHASRPPLSRPSTPPPALAQALPTPPLGPAHPFIGPAHTTSRPLPRCGQAPRPNRLHPPWPALAHGHAGLRQSCLHLKLVTNSF